MKLIILLSLFLFVSCMTAHVAPENDIDSCIIQHLKHKGMLNENFPAKEVVPSAKCGITMAAMKTAVQSQMRASITEKGEKNCIMQEFERAGLVDALWKINVLENETHIEEEERKMMVQAANDVANEILKNSGKKCHNSSSTSSSESSES